MYSVDWQLPKLGAISTSSLTEVKSRDVIFESVYEYFLIYPE